VSTNRNRRIAGNSSCRASSTCPKASDDQWQTILSGANGLDATDSPKAVVGRDRCALTKRLKAHGLEETEASLPSKLGCGTFAATFFLATIAALELERVQLADL